MAHEDEEYSIDPRTGKRHKNLKGMDPQAIKAFSKKAPSIEELRRAVEEDPDSAGFFGLDESADLFLGHLQAPLSKKEINDLKREKSEKKKQSDKAYIEYQKDVQKNLPKKYKEEN